MPEVVLIRFKSIMKRLEDFAIDPQGHAVFASCGYLLFHDLLDPGG